MKLLVLTPVYSPYKGGTAIVAEQNAHMAREAGYSVRVISPKYPSLNEEFIKEMSDFAIPVLFKKPIFSFGNSAFLTGIWNAMREADCIHLHYPFISGLEFQLFLARFFLKKKIIVTYHMDLIAESFVRKILFGMYLFFLAPLLFFTANTLLVTSYDYARYSRLKWLFKIFQKKLRKLPNAVDTHHFFPRKVDQNFYKKYHFDPSEKIFLFVGSLDRAHYFKGVDVLLRAGVLLKKKSLPVSNFVFVGEGDLKKRYQAYARQLGIEQYAHFIGYVPIEELSFFYNAALCVVLPSCTRSEAFGVVLLEGMACGKPVIASNLPGIRSVVQDEKTGFLMRPGDAHDLAEKCEKILLQEERATEMGELGRQVVQEKYSYEQVKKKFIHFLL